MRDNLVNMDHVGTLVTRAYFPFSNPQRLQSTSAEA